MAKISQIVVGKLDMENFISFLARIPLMQRSQKNKESKT